MKKQGLGGDVSDYYGKAVFTDGTEAFLVYRTSPGWVLQPLFPTLEAVEAWHDAGCPQTERESYGEVHRSSGSEEPVHVLINVDYPDKLSMWFYTMASRVDMVITGPNSGLQAEESNELAGGIYSKEFFDAWRTEPALKPVVEKRRRTHDDDGFDL